MCVCVSACLQFSDSGRVFSLFTAKDKKRTLPFLTKRFPLFLCTMEAFHLPIPLFPPLVGDKNPLFTDTHTLTDTHENTRSCE